MITEDKRLCDRCVGIEMEVSKIELANRSVTLVFPRLATLSLPLVPSDQNRPGYSTTEERD